jgi:hypothetical protein
MHRTCPTDDRAHPDPSIYATGGHGPPREQNGHSELALLDAFDVGRAADPVACRVIRLAFSRQPASHRMVVMRSVSLAAASCAVVIDIGWNGKSRDGLDIVHPHATTCSGASRARRGNDEALEHTDDNPAGLRHQAAE